MLLLLLLWRDGDENENDGPKLCTLRMAARNDNAIAAATTRILLDIDRVIILLVQIVVDGEMQ